MDNKRMLIDKNKSPQGGYQFRDAQIGKLISGMSFRRTVDAIIALRRANPRFNLSTDRIMVARELDERTCFRLKNDPRYCREAIPGPPSTSFPAGLASPHPTAPDPSGNVAGANRFIKNTSAGIGLFLEWFGDGSPVESSLAERRADICLGCQFNVRGGMAQRFTQAAASEIMSVFSILNDMDLHTRREEELGTCDLCDCSLKAKVWCPLHIINRHMLQETAGKLPAHCWIRVESDFSADRHSGEMKITGDPAESCQTC